MEPLLYGLWFLFLLLAVPLTLYCLYAYHFYRVQPRMVFLPFQPFDIRAWDWNVDYEEVFYRTRDKLTIHAWYVYGGERDKKRPVVLFCHGNVGNVSQRVDTFKIFEQLGVDCFIFDYRGYGRSQGKPGEKGTYLDGEGAWQYLTEERHVLPQDIIVFGRSLGGAIAAYLAQTFNPGGLVLESTFTSIPDMAKVRFRHLPFNWLVRYRYNTKSRLKDISCPVLVIHSPYDEVIPYYQGRELYEAAKPPKGFLEIKGRHYHGFLKSGPLYVEGLREYFSSLHSTGTERHN